MSNKLLIVSTRLPVSVTKQDGVLQFHPSTGGLATGVSKVSETRDSIWVGWPGISSEELSNKEKSQITQELKKYKCHPVFLTTQEVDYFYSGYCNATIWPLFHYFSNMAEFKTEYWNSYVQVNALFFKEVNKFIKDSSVVWVHDYQLMLLPKLIRDHHANARIGFFLHTPFPSYEIFRILPERTDILEGLLGSDLVGFHTYDYVRHFLSSVQRNLGYDVNLGNITVGNRVVKADAYPISIDYRKFAKTPTVNQVKKILKNIGVLHDKKTVILAVDRADYSKGIPARLDAFETFLKQNPTYHEKVVLILLAVPSRGDVEAYQDLRDTIEQKVSRINGEYSTVDWNPIHYRYQSLPFHELSALYAMADIMLVTPLRDGMNLVAKEYVASHHKGKGVLILSEMAGAASELQEALQVNPNDHQMVADALVTAIEMPTKEQKKRMLAMQDRISTYNISKWAEDYIQGLEATHKESDTTTKRLIGNTLNTLLNDYKTANKRLILLDYDGTLKTFVASPKAALAYPTPKVRRIIKKFTDDHKNKVMVVSGRPKSTLDSFFKNKGPGLVAEHGGWIFDTGSWIKTSLMPKKWKKPIIKILKEYTEKTPGASVEEKDFSIVWHYRNVSPDLAYVRKEELKMTLQNELEHTDIDVYEGNKIIEVKPQNMNKGAIVAEIMSQDVWDFILCIGDDYTDEDMFKVMPDRAYSIKVGFGESSASYQVDTVKDVVNILDQITKLDT